MMRTVGLMAALSVALAGCVPSPGGIAAAAVTGNPTLLDPTGISTEVANAGRMAGIGSGGGMGSQGSFSLSQMGVSLDAVAAGQISAPTGAVSGSAAQAMLASAKGTIVAQNTVAGAAALTRGDVFTIGNAAADTSLKLGRIAQSEAAFAEGMARHNARQAAAGPTGSQLIDNDDRPAEAKALLSIANGGGSASWTNPATGASGTVTLKGPSKGIGGGECRAGSRTYRRGGKSLKGDVLICSEAGAWYEVG